MSQRAEWSTIKAYLTLGSRLRLINSLENLTDPPKKVYDFDAIFDCSRLCVTVVLNFCNF